MKAVVVVLGVLAGVTSANAADKAFATAVFRCWAAPEGFEKADKFVMSVEIDDQGELIDITAIEYEESSMHRAIGESLKRAIMRCAPYDFPAGVYTITIDRSTFGLKNLNPFK